MSNQVYSNERTKYYEYPGLNRYTINGNVLIAPTIAVDIPFDVTDIGNFTHCIDNTTIDGFVALQDGMYSIMVVIGFDINSQLPVESPNFTLDMLLNKPDQFFTGLIIQSIALPVLPRAATGIDTANVSMSAVLYLKASDSIQIRMKNERAAGGPNLNVRAGLSSVTINKIY